MKILIDGYNLIFECGLHGRHVNAESLARARMRLLAEINAAFDENDRREIVIVYDAKKIPLSAQQEQDSSGGVTILYSINFDEADEMIEQLIARHSSPKKNLLVVSSDHRLQKAAMARRAATIDSGDWFDQVESRQSASHSNHGANQGADDVIETKSTGSSPLFTSEEIESLQRDVDQQVDRHGGRGDGRR